MLATIVSLLEKTLIRIGNAGDAEKIKSYGFTTMIESRVAQKLKHWYAKLTSDEIVVLAFLSKRLDARKTPA